MIRFLTADDLPAMESVVRSRQVEFISTPANHARIVAKLAEQLAEGHPMMGLFEDDGLDVFMGWKAIGLVPRADDVARYDQGAVVPTFWTRKKPGGRAKQATGHDINGGLLRKAVLAAMDAQGLYTRWYLIPAPWGETPYHDNPINSGDRAKRVERVAARLEPGKEPEGPYAGFIKRRLRAGSVVEPFVVYVITLKDECRP